MITLAIGIAMFPVIITWQKSGKPDTKDIRGNIRKYLGYGPCSLGTPGMPVSLLGSLVEPGLILLAFPAASGATCPLLPVSPVTNLHV